ncbi:hypothetical protein DFP94_12034 [Fontibacillus phaseoli]|uniref:Uncharacterized protein n=1 Tax=Fontibacillus phaseoli TaxID=1416533 RepID=A0A369AZH4_9BACL|nr:hypothetical protein [Fontibacillus phaseoli]RCX13587.1 hypothetical protein DFP94_12034 [Fontibacillus phaseoli]
MYVSRIVTGRIIEMRGDSVVTVQGDTVATYNLRYYTLRDPELELEFLAETELSPEPGRFVNRWKHWRQRNSGIADLPWSLFWKKDANRI